MVINPGFNCKDFYMSNFELKNLKQHCFDLAYYFFNLHQIEVDKFSDRNFSYWLHLASGIQEVELDLGRVGSVGDGLLDLSMPLYRDARIINTQIVKSLVIFNLIWHTFENLHIDQFSEKNTRNLNALKDFLNSAYDPYKNLIRFNEMISELKRRIRKSHLIDSKQILKNIGMQNKTSVGILLVDKIKNHFAHCAYQFPLGSDPTGEDAIDPLIIDLSSRIVLLTMQMQMLPYFEEKSSLSIKCWWYSDEHKRRIPIHAFLRTVHLKMV